MSCKKWEQQIYLYDDLSASEQKQLEDHLLTCQACTVTMRIARLGMELILEARQANAQLENPDLLARAIMNEIRSDVKAKSRSIFSVILDHVFTRYAFAAASFLIAIFFIVEQNTAPEQSKLFATMPSVVKKEVTLNSSSFLKNVREDQSRKERVTVLSLYSCAKQEGCDNAIVKNLKRRHKS
jgi:hypothetical protein